MALLCKRYPRITICQSHGLFLLLLLLATPSAVQSWQTGPRLRSKVLPLMRIQQHRPGTTSLLFRSHARNNKISNSPLFVQQQQQQQVINGSSSKSSSKNSQTHSNNSDAEEKLGRRARIQNRVSNLWAAIHFLPKVMNSNINMSSQLEPHATEDVLDELETENKLLRETIRQMELENERLASQQKIVLETFEGEAPFFNGRGAQSTNNTMIVAEEDIFNQGVTLSGEELAGVTTSASDKGELWCDDLDGDSCPVEPTVSFGTALKDRAYWLVGLLVMQSLSGLILSRNEALLAHHPVIIYFLTMLVGAGGNAGNQASVRVIRGIALGTLNAKTQGQFLSRELKMAASLSVILSIAGFLRAAVFRTPFAETVAVTASLALIVFTSICLGAVLPLLLQKMGVDPAHSSTTIQVVMDILGVFVAVAISGFILDSPLGISLMNVLRW